MQLIRGDCYEEIKKIPDNSVDLVITDPPYEIKGIHNCKGVIEDRPYLFQMRDSNLGEGIDLVLLDELTRVLKNIYIYIWCNKEQIYDYMTYFVEEKGCNFEIMIWHKTNTPPFTNNHYLKDKEYCLLFWDKKCKVVGKYDTLKTVYTSGINIKDKKLYKHPTIKPLDIIENFIKNSTKEGDTVLDCFMGSGTTGVACRNLNRNFIGIEIDEEYYEIRKERIENQNQQITIFDLI